MAQTHKVVRAVASATVSAKAKLAAGLTGSIGTLSGIGITWIVTAELDKAALAGALTGITSAALAFLGAWLGEPGDVVIDVQKLNAVERKPSPGAHVDPPLRR